MGVLLLIGFQYAAEWTQGQIMIGFGIRTLIFYIVKFIGFSYNCANDPRNGFLLSFFGYTLGVGLCEEICKAIPLLVRFQQLEGSSRNSSNTWQTACLWGMASGIGFGIAEEILYSGSQYNGMSSGLIYLVRFVLASRCMRFGPARSASRCSIAKGSLRETTPGTNTASRCC